MVLAQGRTVTDACRRIGATQQSYYRWHKEHDNMTMDQDSQAIKRCNQQELLSEGLSVIIALDKQGVALANE